MRSDLTSEAVVASEAKILFVVRTSKFCPVSVLWNLWKFLIFSEANGMIFSETKQFFHNECLRGCFEASEAKKSPPAISLSVCRRSIRSVPCCIFDHFLSTKVRLFMVLFLKSSTKVTKRRTKTKQREFSPRRNGELYGTFMPFQSNSVD